MSKEICSLLRPFSLSVNKPLSSAQTEQKRTRKANIFFDVCRLLPDLFPLFFFAFFPAFTCCEQTLRIQYDKSKISRSHSDSVNAPLVKFLISIKSVVDL